MSDDEQQQDPIALARRAGGQIGHAVSQGPLGLDNATLGRLDLATLAGRQALLKALIVALGQHRITASAATAMANMVRAAADDQRQDLEPQVKALVKHIETLRGGVR